VKLNSTREVSWNIPRENWGHYHMSHIDLTFKAGAPLLERAAFQTADPETGRNLLDDSQAPKTDGQVTAPKTDGQGAAPKTDVQVGGTTTPGADQSAVATGASSSQPTETDPKIIDMLSHATQLKANVVIPGQVVEINDLNFNRQPAWNPHAIQKGPVDTIDDLILDSDGSIKINPNKEAKAPGDGTVSIGIKAAEMHWSPLFLPPQQQKTIRDTVAALRKNNPHFPVPAPLENVPWDCLAALPAQQKKPAVDPALFQKLDMNKLTDRIVSAVTANEGNSTTVTTNDAGYGWSLGMRQWNQEVGELPTLLGAMYKNDPCKFVKDFGPYASKLINKAGDPPNATVNENFIRHADFSALLGFTDAKHKHVKYVPDVEKALSDFQDVQFALSRQWVKRGENLAKKYGFTSELGWAEVCDMVNQKGAGGTERTLKLIPTATKANELNRLRALETAAHRPGGQTRLSNLEKKFSANIRATDTTATKKAVTKTTATNISD
jgi:hypothetical protein